MMIVNNLVNSQNVKQKPSFRGADSFNAIKALPNMICAICGKPTLSSDAYIKAITPLSKPLVYSLNNGALGYLEKKYPQIFEFVQNLATRYPKKNLDEILEREDNYILLKQEVVKAVNESPDVVSMPDGIEKDRIINRVFFDMIENARAFMKSSSVVIKNLLSLKPILAGTRKEVFEQFEIYSRKYPKKSLAEIVNNPQIREFHMMKNLLQRMETREKLDYHFENILNLITKKKPSAVEEFDELKEKVIEMYETEPDERARVYYAKEMYREALKKHACEDLEKSVFTELEQIPKTFLTKDSFFNHAYNHNFSDGRIVTSLFSGSVASEDHIIPISRGGIDRMENKVVTHRYCNGMRGSSSYAEMVKYNTEMPSHVQEQMNIVTESLLDNKLSEDLRYYPVKVAEQLLQESGGVIDIDIEDFCIKGIKDIDGRIKSNDTVIDSLVSEKQQIEGQINDLTDLNHKERHLQYRMKEYLEKH